MKKTNKLWGLLLVAAMIGTLFAGCGNHVQQETEQKQETADSTPVEDSESDSESEADSDSEAAKDFSGTITISAQARAGADEAWKAVAAAYNEYHPNVEIVVDLKPADGYGDWIANTCRSENPAVDIAEFDAGDYLSATMIDLSDYLELDSPYSDGIWADQFDASAIGVSTATNRTEKLSLFSTQVMWMYNQEIFAEVGVEPPTTWDELIAVCEKLDAAGYQPIAIDGDYQSYVGMTMSWLAQIYIDQTTRSLINVYGAKEGDYCYDPDIDGTWTYDPTDPWNDDTNKVTQNIVRVCKALSEGEYRMDTAGAKTVWSNFAKVFPQYAGGEAMFATSQEGSGNAFYQGKAAMIINGGWGIIDYMRIMEEFEASGFYEDASGNKVEGNIFTLGTFAMPTMEGEGIEAPVRTIEVPTAGLMAMSKDQEHNDMVMDFLMFWSSYEGMTIYLDVLLENGGILDGPSYVYDVEYPEKIASAFENIQYIGNAQKGYGAVFAKGVPLVDESGREFYNDSYEYFMGNITIDEFLARNQTNLETYLPMLMQGLNISEEDIKNPANAPAGY